MLTGISLLARKVESVRDHYQSADMFTTTFSPYLLRFFTVNYALSLNLNILRLNKHRFFKIQKGTYRD